MDGVAEFYISPKILFQTRKLRRLRHFSCHDIGCVFGVGCVLDVW